MIFLRSAAHNSYWIELLPVWRKSRRTRQIIIATHSPELIDLGSSRTVVRGRPSA
jgi:predicted ATPase